MQSKLTRRAVLAGAPAVAVAATVASIPAAARANLGCADTLVARRYREHQAATEAFRRALRHLAKVEAKYFAVAKFRVLGPNSDERKALEVKMGVDKAMSEERRTSNEQGKAIQRLLDTPAKTVHDLYLKIKALQEGDWDWRDQEVTAICRDVERLTGGVS